MKISLPSFLRKKSRSARGRSAASSSLTSSGLSHSSGSGSTSEGSSNWSSSLHAQKASDSDKVVSDVVFPEATGKLEEGFVFPSLKSPFRDQNHELEEAFIRFDANGDGKISTAELGAVLRSLGDNPTEEELILMVKDVDKDGDGFIDLQEFILLNSAGSGDELKDAFQVFDADDDGKISAQELHRVLVGLGESCTIEECGRMIRGVDTDGDGFVNFEEFCRMMSLH